MSLKNTKYVSLDRVFATLSRMGFKSMAEDDVIEWSGEALEAIGCINQYEEAVCFVEVKNHQISVPNGNYAIIQIARNNCFNKDEGILLCPQNIQEEVNSGEQASIPVMLDCNGTPLQEYDLAYYRPYFDLQWEYSPYKTSRLYRTCFTPVKLTNHSFFNSMVCKEDGHEEIYKNSVDEYNIYGGDTIRFSFREGQVAIAYNRTKLDEDGLPLIPDQISYITAAAYYNIFKMMEREFYQNRDGAEKRMDKAESQWQWYCKQAGNFAKMLSGVDEHENFKNQRSYLLPNNNRYAGFFGKLSAPEDRAYDNPSRRFNRFRGYR